MPFVRRSRADIDEKTLLENLAKVPQPTEEEIERQAAEDGTTWREGDFEGAVLVYSSPAADRLRRLRNRLGLTQAQFADRYGFTVDTIQQYEDGRQVPSGPAATLLRVIAAEPDAVERSLAQPAEV